MRNYVCRRVWLVGVLALSFCWVPGSGVAQGFTGERVYEQVSPTFKGGYGVGTLKMISPTGDAAAFDALGVFAHTPWNPGLELHYIAHRVEGVGWVTESLQPPPPFFTPEDFSANLELAIAGGPAGARKAGEEGTGTVTLVHKTDLPDTAVQSNGSLVSANWEPFNTELEVLEFESRLQTIEGRSSDLCHEFDWAKVHGTVALYDLSRDCHGGEPPLRIVNVDNAGAVITPQCPAEIGAGAYYGGQQVNRYKALSADGATVFFTANVVSGIPTGSCSAHGQQLFVRLGGEKTLEVSRPLGESCGEVPCPAAPSRPNAYFKGASEDGSRVFFTTDASLAEGDKDTSNDLYLASLGCGAGAPGCGVSERQVVSLTQVSLDPHPGEAAEMVGVVRVAPDGSRVYFVAHGVLSEAANAEGGVAVAGAENMYVYDVEDKQTAFITDLCSGPATSGNVEDTSCPPNLESQVGGAARNDTGLWQADPEAQTTRDGGVLVFASYGRLVKGDADSARDVYRYDASSGSLIRVSIGEEGYDSNGNDEFDASVRAAGAVAGGYASTGLELDERAVSDDGTRIVFSSAGPLSPRAVNGLENVYEWSAQGGPGGRVSMISGGASPNNDEDPIVSPSGRDVFFITTQGLVAGDTDGLRDVYDARFEGGFPPVAAPRLACSSDACQGPLSNPAPLLVPGGAVQAPGENYARPPVKKTTKKKKKGKAGPRGSARRRRRSRRSRVARGSRTGRVRVARARVSAGNGGVW